LGLANWPRCWLDTRARLDGKHPSTHSDRMGNRPWAWH
jgi:hypothetical protein